MADTQILKATQKTAVALVIEDSRGNPAPVDGSPVWAQSNESVLTMTVASDGMSAELVAAGPVGNTQVSVTCDADLGDGVTPIVGMLDVQVVAGDAVFVQLQASTPEEQ